MNKFSKLAAAALTASLLTCAPAAADSNDDRAVAIAQSVWHTDHPIQVIHEAPYEAGWAAWSYEGTYVVHISDKESDLRSFEPLCSTVIHEVGHIVGWRSAIGGVHSENPNSVMYYQQQFGQGRVVRHGHVGPLQWTGTDRRCRQGGRAYLATRHLTRAR